MGLPSSGHRGARPSCLADSLQQTDAAPTPRHPVAPAPTEPYTITYPVMERISRAVSRTSTAASER
jgi:hypothetical protein